MSGVDVDRMLASLSAMAAWAKPAGSPGERQAFEHLRADLAGAGFRTRLIEHDAYISLPGPATLDVGGTGFAAITHSMAQPTGPAGRSAALLDLGDGSAAAFARPGLAGYIVLVDGIASPAVAMRATRAGARGVIHVSPHHLLHEMCVSPVWGSPGLAERDALPAVPVVTVSAEDGAAIRALPPASVATIHAEVDTGWRRTPLLEAELMPQGRDDAPFVLMSCHVDTWFEGVMDNGAANVVVAEVARLCAGDRGTWRRGLRVCFWSGHSQGRYSGSAWYADTHWAELDARCLAHVNLDSPGAIGATVLGKTGSAGGLFDLARAAIAAETGQELEGKRKARSADDSFPGIGIPSVFGSLSTQAPGPVKLRNELGWWWHTAHDRLDKIDRDHLLRDARIVGRVVRPLLSDEAPPVDFRRQIEGLRAELVTLDRRSLADACTSLIAAMGGLDDAAAMAVSRILVPLDYTRGDRFVHDPALPLAAWPVLEPLRRLAALPGDAADRPFAQVDAVRAANRLGHALAQALRACAR